MILAHIAALAGLAIPSGTPANSIRGEYIESRSCNVYIGACHANGELVTEGRQALMIWHIDQGKLDGVDVSGLNVVAAVTGDTNLATAATPRKSVLIIDSRATAEQRERLEATVKERYGKQLGEVTASQSSPVEYTKSGLDYTVRVPNVAYVRTTRFACDHCVMPHLQWYQPYVNLKSSLIAKASLVEFKGTEAFPVKWKRLDENNSFVGVFQD